MVPRGVFAQAPHKAELETKGPCAGKVSGARCQEVRSWKNAQPGREGQSKAASVRWATLGTAGAQNHEGAGRAGAQGPSLRPHC